MLRGKQSFCLRLLHCRRRSTFYHWLWSILLIVVQLRNSQIWRSSRVWQRFLILSISRRKFIWSWIYPTQTESHVYTNYSSPYYPASHHCSISKDTYSQSTSTLPNHGFSIQCLNSFSRHAQHAWSTARTSSPTRLRETWPKTQEYLPRIQYTVQYSAWENQHPS